MKTLVFANQKGGVGKSTLCAHLAVEAGRRGQKSAIVDVDPQGSLVAWWNVRADPLPLFVQAGPKSIQEAARTLESQKADWLLVDTPPAIPEAILAVCKAADLVLIPVRPSPHDLRSVGATVNMVESLGKPICFLINSATLRAKITAQAAIALSQHGTVAPVMVGHRVDFAASMTDGRTVQELDPKGASAGEVASLWDYVLTRIRK